MDRDGVINHDPGDYTKHVSEFKFLPGIAETLRLFSKSGFDLVVITNQGGIAKGLYTLDDFYEIDAHMHGFFTEQGVKVLQTYFCPHHPDFGKCLCRKPASLMVQKALQKYAISPHQSFMVGDKQRDVDCAEGAGVKGVLIGTNDLLARHVYRFGL